MFKSHCSSSYSSHKNHDWDYNKHCHDDYSKCDDYDDKCYDDYSKCHDNRDDSCHSYDHSSSYHHS